MDTAIAASPDSRACSLVATGRACVRIGCVEPATVADDAAFRRMLRETPMGGSIQVALEREPGFFAAAQIEAERHHAICSRDKDTGAVVAIATRSVRQRLVNGEPQLLGYLSQLRIAPSHRHLTRHILRDGFGVLRDSHASDEARFDIASIIAGNMPARRILEAGLPGLPRFTPVDRVITMLLPVRRLGFRRTANAARQQPPTCDVRAFGQFAPSWSADEISRVDAMHSGGGHCLALWDQRAFKQAVVRGYQGWLKYCRAWLGLPKPGSVLPMACLVTLAVDAKKPDAFLHLLDESLLAARGTDLRWLILGLSARHPFTGMVLRRYHPHTYESILYAVHDSGTTVRLDERISQVEVATL